MNIPDFLEWDGEQEHHHELIDGSVIAIMPSPQGHGVVISNLVLGLTPLARAAGMRTTTRTSALATGPRTVRYPDLVVDAGPRAPERRLVVCPSILVDVRRHGEEGRDRIDEYRSMPTVEVVLVVSWDRVHVEVWRRDVGGWQFRLLQSLTDVVDLSPLKGTLALSVIYDTMDLVSRAKEAN